MSPYSVAVQLPEIRGGATLLCLFLPFLAFVSLAGYCVAFELKAIYGADRRIEAIPKSAVCSLGEGYLALWSKSHDLLRRVDRTGFVLRLLPVLGEVRQRLPGVDLVHDGGAVDDAVDGLEHSQSSDVSVSAAARRRQQSSSAIQATSVMDGVVPTATRRSWVWRRMIGPIWFENGISKRVAALPVIGTAFGG